MSVFLVHNRMFERSGTKSVFVIWLGLVFIFIFVCFYVWVFFFQVFVGLVWFCSVGGILFLFLLPCAKSVPNANTQWVIINIH